jgi:hypothetical protein
MNNSSTCPVCNKNLRIFHVHAAGKYEVVCYELTTYKTIVYVGTSGDYILRFKKRIYLDEERIEKLLLLQ